MKTSEIVGTLRTLIKAHSDDSSFSDSFLYSLLIQARSEILSQKLRKFQPLSPFNEQTICVPLVKEKFHDCSCVSVGCTVLKSEFEIPQPLTTRTGIYLKVMTVEGKELPFVPATRRPIIKHSNTQGDVLSYDVYNNKIVIWNNTLIPTVLVRAVFYDPSDLETIPECDPLGNTVSNTCYNPMTDEFPMEPDSISRMLQSALRLLGMAMQIPDDEINNTNADNE